MEGQQKRQWGVTSAISETQPTDRELKLNDKLIEALKAENNFETPEGIKNRAEVLDHLQKVVEEFIRRASKAKGLPTSTVDSSGGRICWFGSYALGVYNPGSDIDTLVVAPKHVYIEDFFEHFPRTFKEMTPASEITEFIAVEKAHVPIIKMIFRGVSFDLLFVSLPTQSQIPRDMDLTDKSLLRGLDDQGMRSINGTRTVRELLDSVPQHKPFRIALRAVKLWSKRRGIYGNVYGYPGGIAWAIMVARICQLYPYACGATILSKFFNLMGKWHWPRPVMLKTIEEGSIMLRVWNPAIYPQDRAHHMPIITPAFPSMCSTHTIMISTKDILMKEFKRADDLLGLILDGKKAWSDLFSRSTFFTEDHRYYLSIVAGGRTKEAHDTFAGLVQSKVRLIAKGIDDGVDGIKIARPYPNAFERTHRCGNEDQVARVALGNQDYRVKKGDTIEADADASNGNAAKETHTVYTSTFYIGLTAEDNKGQLDLSFPVGEFKRIVTSDEIYNEQIMSIHVAHVRNHDLPDDLFLEGETRPKKPVKEKKKKVNSKSAKRPFTETGLDDSEHSAKRRQPENVNGLPKATPV